MSIRVEKQEHPEVYSVPSFKGVEKFYETLGYKTIIPKGLEGFVLRFEAILPVPIIIFRRSTQNNEHRQTTIYMKISSQKLEKIQGSLKSYGTEFIDPNGIRILLDADAKTDLRKRETI